MTLKLIWTKFTLIYISIKVDTSFQINWAESHLKMNLVLVGTYTKKDTIAVNTAIAEDIPWKTLQKYYIDSSAVFRILKEQF